MSIQTLSQYQAKIQSTSSSYNQNNGQVQSSSQAQNTIQSQSQPQTQTQSNNQQLILLQNYNKKLEDENLAKTSQIKALNQQLSKVNTNARIISTSTVSASSCTNCKNKQNEISNLNRLIKQIKENYEKQIQRMRTQRQTVQTVRQVPSASQQAELQSIKRAYDELRVRYEEMQKSEWSTLKVDGQQGSNIEQYRQQSDLIRQQNQALQGKIQFLQKRIATLEDANRVLRQQILAHVGTTRTTTHAVPIYATQPIAVQPPITTYLRQASPIIQPQPQPQTIFNYISPPQQLPPQQLPPQQQKTVTFQLPPPSTYITEVVQPPPYQRQRIQQYSYLSPLSVLGHRHSTTALASGYGLASSSAHHHHQPYNNYTHYDTSYDSDYYKDIVEQRWRSLQHKIRLLQSENSVLRTQIGTHGY